MISSGDLLLSLATQERVPRCCVNLVWRVRRLDDHEVVEVQFLALPLTEEKLEEMEVRRENLSLATSQGEDCACFVCFDPCVDADDYRPNGRKANCKRCELLDNTWCVNTWTQETRGSKARE